MKTVHRKIQRGSLPLDSPHDVSQGGPKCQRATNLEGQLDGDACTEAMSLLSHTTDKSLIFQKMRETFQHRQKLVKDPGSSGDILSTFPRFVSSDELPDATQIHAAPGVLSSLSPLIVKNGHMRR